MGSTFVALCAALAVFGSMSVAFPRNAAAESTRLSWDQCAGPGAGKQFACDTNAGGARLVVSAVRDSVGSFTSGFSLSIEVWSVGPTLPTWWALEPSGCRSGAATRSFDPEPQDASCLDSWLGEMAGGLTFTPIDPGRLRVSLAGVNPTETLTMTAGVETFIAAIGLSYQGSTGPGSCNGCTSATCLVLRDLTIVDEAGLRVDPIPVSTDSGVLAWQDSLATCLAVPTRTSTWGRLKSLYR